MTKSSNDQQQLLPLVKELQDFSFSQVGSIMILRTLGYGLLLLALFDIVEMLVPPSFMNPAWEFSTFGAIVERVPVPLIGLGLVFYGNLHSRSKWEFLSLRFFSWLTLVLTVVFILLIPLSVVNTVRLSKQNVSQINALSDQQISQAEQIEKRVNQATPEQINNLLKAQNQPLGEKSTQEQKNQILSQVSQAKAQIKTQAEAAQSSRNVNLFKNSVKWNLGSLVAAALYFTFWKTTKWARIKP
ncbi:HpsJ family protein [Fortiea contorta]|uniref:HpsJ-like protein, cyanoexosortase A-associated n=1 Tax=Fortiea contorta TaxID=1892405 RepID=UPI00034CF0DC|nr:HpsJ family protein [Fortiea contorta]